jgi:hypothetical protein
MMKLAALSFVAAVLVAPLAAQAADTPARFDVALRATVVDRFTYESTVSAEECTITRSGSGGQALTVRSVRALRVQVSGGSGGVVYTPSRLAVRVTGRTTGGSSDEVRRCRAAPLERSHRDCAGRTLRPRSARARFFRPTANRIGFRKVSRPAAGICGLQTALSASWLDLARGTVDEDALLNGGALRVVVRGAASREQEEAALKLKHRTTVRWTLTFRRLG